MPACLTLHPSRRPARRHLLDDGAVYRLGRDASCELVVDDERISRRHARLWDDAGGWRLLDLGSKNGTLAGGLPADGRPIELPCWVSFGGLLARLEVLSEVERRRRATEEVVRRESSVELGHRLVPGLGAAALLDELLASTLDLAGAERAFVVLGVAGGELAVRAARGVAPGDLELPEFAGSAGAVERVLAERRAVAAGDVGAVPWLAARPSIAGGSIRALVCLPLLALGRLLGAVYADSSRPGQVYTELDVEILQALADHAALALAAAELEAELGALRALEPASATRGASSWSRVREAHAGAGAAW